MEKWWVSYLRTGRVKMAQIHVCRNREHLIEVLDEIIANLGKEYSNKILKRVY